MKLQGFFSKKGLPDGDYLEYLWVGLFFWCCLCLNQKSAFGS